MQTHALFNRAIGEIKFRDEFGVTIIAIIRKNHERILNPGANETFHKGDTVVLSGERAKIQAVIAKLFN